MYASVLTLSNFATKIQTARVTVTFIFIHDILQPRKLFSAHVEIYIEVSIISLKTVRSQNAFSIRKTHTL
jgi:hypothetical protein